MTGAAAIAEIGIARDLSHGRIDGCHVWLKASQESVQPLAVAEPPSQRNRGFDQARWRNQQALARKKHVGEHLLFHFLQSDNHDR
jgi:hypothetical protein